MFVFRYGFPSLSVVPEVTMFTNYKLLSARLISPVSWRKTQSSSLSWSNTHLNRIIYLSLLPWHSITASLAFCYKTRLPRWSQLNWTGINELLRFNGFSLCFRRRKDNSTAGNSLSVIAGNVIIDQHRVVT